MTISSRRKRSSAVRFWILDFGFWITSFICLLFYSWDLGLGIWDFALAAVDGEALDGPAVLEGEEAADEGEPEELEGEDLGELIPGEGDEEFGGGVDGEVEGEKAGDGLEWFGEKVYGDEQAAEDEDEFLVDEAEGEGVFGDEGK